MSLGALGNAANLVIAASYLFITAVMVVPLVREHQIRANRLGTATAAIFFTCAVHHGAAAALGVAAAAGLKLTAGTVFLFACAVHPAAGGVLAVAGPVGVPLASAVPTPPAWDWYSVVWDVFGAALGVYYVTLRRTYGPLMRGPVLFDDLKEQQRQAVQINDNIVQGLTVAHLALDLDDVERGAAALEDTLEAARSIISGLLQDPGTNRRLRPGDLVRHEAAETTLSRNRRHR